MSENHIGININTNNLNLSSDEISTLFIEIKNNLDERVDNVLLRNFIDSEYIIIQPNEFNITNNNFINLGSFDPNEKKFIQFNLKTIINYKKTCEIYSIINYSIFENGRPVSINIKSNELKFNLNPNSNDKPFYDTSIRNYNLTRSSEMLLDETSSSEYINFNDFYDTQSNTIDNLEPKLVGFNNSSEITKIVDNENPKIGDIITFNCYIKNIGFANCKKIQYEDELNSCLEFIEGSLYVNDEPYEGNICYGIKINDFQVNDEINICYQAKVVNISQSNIFSDSSTLIYSYISNQCINHKTIKINFPSLKKSKQNNLNSFNNIIFNKNNFEQIPINKDIFRNELSIATYSLNILDTSNLSSVIPDNKYHYSFEIENDGNMNCEKIEIKINLPSSFKYNKNSLYLNDNLANIVNLDDCIVLNNIKPGEYIDLDFEFIPEYSPDANKLVISIDINSEFRNYSNEKIEKNLSMKSLPIEIEDTVIKNLLIESEYHIKNPDPSVNKILNVECKAFVLGCSEVKPAKNRAYRNDKKLSVKGYILNKIKYLSIHNEVYSIVKKTPFNTILSIDNDLEFDSSKLKLRCNDISFRYINRKLIYVSNSLSIH